MEFKAATTDNTAPKQDEFEGSIHKTMAGGGLAGKVIGGIFKAGSKGMGKKFMKMLKTWAGIHEIKDKDIPVDACER